jgi:hypothetical protein
VGELLGEAVDVLRREGLERDGCLSLFHGVDCTSIPPIFEHPHSHVCVQLFLMMYKLIFSAIICASVSSS